MNQSIVTRSYLQTVLWPDLELRRVTFNQASQLHQHSSGRGSIAASHPAGRNQSIIRPTDNDCKKRHTCRWIHYRAGDIHDRRVASTINQPKEQNCARYKCRQPDGLDELQLLSNLDSSA
jgi:hypothetical protein